ncbi:hypothetical protein GCM10027341_39150 [Spirosoma knui]
MNTLFKKSITTVGFVASFGLLSCQENNLVTPDKPVYASTESAKDIISPGLPKNYQLVKHGQATLTYLADGKLQKVTYGPGTYANIYNRTEYNYGFLSIKATSYDGNKVGQEDTYQIDVNTGRCYESKHVTYSYYSSGTVVNEKNWVYKYTDKGQLKTRANKSNGAERTDYSFNAEGDLAKVTSYGANGAASNEITFAYNQPVSDPILDDRTALNPGWANLPDTYLKIFGKSSKHLVKRITQKKLPGNQIQFDRFHNYTLNADGYVTEEKEFNVANAALVDTKPYDYKISVISVQP